MKLLFEKSTPGRHGNYVPAPDADAKPLDFGPVLSDSRLVKSYGTPREEVVRIDFDALFDGDRSQDLLMDPGDVLFVPETATSNVLDFLKRILAPLTPSVQTADSTKRLVTGE